MKKAIPASTFSLALALALGSGPALAQSDPTAPTVNANGTEIVVTATRSGDAIPIDLLGASVTILDDAALNQRQTRVVSDVLRDVPGRRGQSHRRGRRFHPGPHPRRRGQPHAGADRRHQGLRPVLRRVRLRHAARRRGRQDRGAARPAVRALRLGRDRRRDQLHHPDRRRGTRAQAPRRGRLEGDPQRRGARRGRHRPARLRVLRQLLPHRRLPDRGRRHARRRLGQRRCDRQGQLDAGCQTSS